jgi:hypothetical protein
MKMVRIKTENQKREAKIALSPRAHIEKFYEYEN